MKAEGFDFGLGLDPGMSWEGYLALLDRHRAGVGLPTGWVPSTFLVADVDGVIVGRSSIRHRLVAALEAEGGHIGFCILPSYRRRGLASEVLRQSLLVARGLGVASVLVTCDESNSGSRKVIESCGGARQERRDDRPTTLRYQFD